MTQSRPESSNVEGFTRPSWRYASELEALLENADGSLYLLDREGRYLAFSRGHAEVMKALYGAEIAVGKRLYDFMTVREDRERAMRNVERALNGEKLVVADDVGEQSLLRGYREAVHTPVRDEQGAVVAVAIASRDVSRRKRGQSKLQESEERFRLAFDRSLIGKTMTAPDGRLIRVNQAFCDMLGYTAHELTAETFMALTHPDDLEMSTERVRMLLAGKDDCAVFEKRYLARDGRVVHAQVSAMLLRTAEGAPIHFVTDVLDIGERKRAETAQRELMDKLRIAIDEAPIGLTAVGLDHRFLSANRAFCAFTGYTEEELRQRTIDDITYPEDVPIGQTESRAIAGGDRQTAHIYKRYVRKDGAIMWGEVNINVVRNNKGEPQYFLPTIQDITERKRAEEETARLEAQLQQAQKMESVGRLAGGVAHDFNNLLGVILGHVELAMLQVDPTQPLHADLEEIKAAAQRSADLTRQLLAFARKQTVAPKVLDLNETVASMLKMLRRLIGEDIELAWRPSQDGWPVKVDPTQIDQILANLCVNARDAIAGVGNLTIETGSCTIDEDYCASHAEASPGDYVRLTVSDDGCGMDKQTQLRLFEPFFTTKEMGTGTGLGLATVYGIVKQNSGFINVYSELGVGTTFAIYLPRHEGKAGQGRQDASAEPAARGGETILLVEDEPTLLKIGKRLLETFGYMVLAAGSPGEAIRLAAEHAGEIHLLMTDVIMPEMNGRDLARNLSALYPAIKRLFMSGYTANAIAHHGVLHEGVDFIQKPFSAKDLAAKVREVLDR